MLLHMKKNKYNNTGEQNNLPEMICSFFDDITRFWELQEKVSEKMSNELEVLNNSLDRQQ